MVRAPPGPDRLPIIRSAAIRSPDRARVRERGLGRGRDARHGIGGRRPARKPGCRPRGTPRPSTSSRSWSPACATGSGRRSDPRSRRSSSSTTSSSPSRGSASRSPTRANGLTCCCSCSSRSSSGGWPPLVRSEPAKPPGAPRSRPRCSRSAASWRPRRTSPRPGAGIVDRLVRDVGLERAWIVADWGAGHRHRGFAAGRAVADVAVRDEFRPDARRAARKWAASRGQRRRHARQCRRRHAAHQGSDGCRERGDGLAQGPPTRGRRASQPGGDAPAGACRGQLALALRREELRQAATQTEIAQRATR